LIPNGSLSLRAGTFYETAAVPPEFVRLDFMPFERVGATLGVGLRWGRYHLDLGYAYVHHFQMHVKPPDGTPECGFPGAIKGNCGSMNKKLVPIVPGVDKFGDPVGNGIYDVGVHEWTLGLKVTFDAAR
jgi:hypothetical protein